MDYALSFDGTDDLVTVTYAEALDPDTFSVEMFVRFPALPSASAVIASCLKAPKPSYNPYGWSIQIDTNGTITGGVYNGSFYVANAAFGTVSINRWHHIVLVYDGTDAIGYFDGIEGGKESGPRGKGGVDIVFGYDSDRTNYTGYLKGYLNHIRLYGDALTAAEVADHHKGNYASSDNLLALWTCNEGTGTTMGDSENDYDGTISGCTWIEAYEIFSANEVVETVKDTLNAAGLTLVAENHFGKSVQSLERIFQQCGYCYIFYEGCDAMPETNETWRFRIWLQFVVIDQIMGVDPDKNDYAADELRGYLCASAWRDLGLQTKYPTDNFRYFFVTSERQYTYDKQGRTVTVFRGYIDAEEVGLT